MLVVESKLCEWHWCTSQDSLLTVLLQGVPAKDLWKEISSYDTVGNAYFALAIHALPANWR